MFEESPPNATIIQDGGGHNPSMSQATTHIASHQAFHLWITYGWLGEAMATILVVIIIIWATIMHYSYRNKWRTLDVLMAAVLLQELPQAILVFVISLINGSFINLSPRSSSDDDHHHHHHHNHLHPHPSNHTMFSSSYHDTTSTTICDVLLWCNHALRFFQFAIITSLIVDRALILKWPYQYRFTVRHSQIRFYMISLALISSLFGAFAVISHQSHLDNVVQVTTVVQPPPTLTPIDTRPVSTVNSTDTELISSRNNTITVDAEDNNRTSMMIWKEEPSSSSYDVSNEFSVYNPNIYDLRFGYFVLTIYILLTLICFGSFLYVEINRPRISLSGGGGVLDTPNTTTTNTTISSITQSHTANNNNHRQQQQQQLNSAKTSLNHSQQRYLQSIATMFTATTATNGSSTSSSSSAASNNTTATASSSTSSSLSASGSPVPSRFSSMANLTGASVEGVGESLGDHHQSSKTTQSTLPSYYYPNVEQQNPQQNQLSINDDSILQDNHGGGAHQSSHGHHHTASSTYTSMTTTDNSIRRLIHDGGSGLNKHQSHQAEMNQNDGQDVIDHPHQLRHLSPLDLILPSVLSRVNSLQSKSHQPHQLHHKLNHHSPPLPLYSHNGSQLKLNTNDSSNDSSSTFSAHHQRGYHQRNHHHLYHHRHSPHHHHHHHHHHHSAFDLRWSAVVGPVSFCFAFNHGPYLVFTLLAILIPGIWTPFHDLILAGLSLFQALFLPLIIFISNETFRESIQRSSCCCWCWCCTDQDHDHDHSYHHRHNQHNRQHHHHHHHHHLHSMHKISMANNPKSSLAFSTNDGNVIMATPPPSYLHVAAANASVKQMSALATTISSSDGGGGGGYHHSDLDLLRKYSKNAFDQSPKLSKISFLKHNKDLAFNFSNYNGNDNSNHHHHKPMAHATSMLDLSRNGGTSYHHQQQQQHPNYYQQQQQHHQQHYHASRSRHSLAAQLSNNHHQNHKHNGYNNQNEDTLTPKSSFHRRPPSVASCNYLFSNQSVQSSNKGASSVVAAAAAAVSSANRCSQYLFGSNKSESTLSVPLATVVSTHPTSSTTAAASVAVATSTVTTTTSAASTLSNVIDKCSPISINLNHRFDPPAATPMATTTTNNEMIDLDNNNHVNHDDDGNDDDDDDIVLGHHHSNHVNIKSTNNATNKCGGPKLLELISGLTGRSASNSANGGGGGGSRKRSVRKCDSDASTFFHHKNLKRSQIAQNQLSNILFNNFLSKKFHPTSSGSKNSNTGNHVASNPNGSSFGSEIILIQENDDHQINGSRTPPPLTTTSSLSSMFRRFDQEDDPYYHHHANHGNQFPRPHVYLPNIVMMANDSSASGSCLESNTRSNSCQQLSILNQAETDHYHNHLLLKQNLSTATVPATTTTPSTVVVDMDRGKKSNNNKKNKKKTNNNNSNGGNDSNNKNSVGFGGGNGKNGKNSIIATAAAAAAAAASLVEDEPIYASLPEVVEDEISKTSAASSGTFSARSTLPDDCQLILYGSGGGGNDQDDTNNENQLNNNKFLKKKKNFNIDDNNGGGNNNASSTTEANNHHQASRMAAENVQGGENGNDVNYTKDNHHQQHRRYHGRTTINDEIGNNNNNSSSNSSSSSSSTVGESIEDIYEEVDHSMIILQQRNNDDDGNNDGGGGGNLSHHKRTASEDTLIQQKVDQRHQPSKDFSRDDEDEDDDDMSCGEAEDLDEDQISILSETSSSTFSSFTTCANQDFEFIVSQQLSNIAQKNQQQNQDADQNPESHINNRVGNQSGGNLAEPSTLSMAAMYYNRLIMNKDSNHAKSGHRQRSKLNRRQSFSTAHELRQRILCSQSSMMNQNGKESSTSNQQKMSLIEEECHPEEMVANHHGAASANDDYPLFTANFNDMFPFKLDRRISSSEDNLLSIISTIVNCGDQETEPNTPTKVCGNNQATANQVDESKNSHDDSNASSTPKHHHPSSNNGTFLMKKDSLITKSNNTNNQVSAIPRATFLTPKSVSSSSSSTSSTPSTPSTPSSKTAAKITIKELKSKKQQQQKTSANRKVLANGQPPPTTSKTSATKLLMAGANSPNRVYELGSLWERQSSSAAPTTPSKAIKAAKSPQIGRPTAASRSGVPVPVSPRSNHQPPPSPSRVPTFISVSPLRKKPLPTTNPSSNGFASKLPPPSEYVNGGNGKQKPKQDARQNAILAKNALLMSGMASKSASNK